MLDTNLRVSIGRLALFTFLILAVMLPFAAADVSAKDFKSFNGGFKITLPESWKQVDYQTADYHLSQSGADLDYEAVFNDGSEEAMFGNQYLILTVDTVGTMTAAQVDSLITTLEGEFDKKSLRIGDEQYISEAHPDVIAYDTVNNVISVVSTLADESGSRKNLLAMKIYDKGVANFYFYSPAEIFDEGLPAFRSVLASFTTDMTSNSADAQPVKIAKLDNEDGLSTSSMLIILGSIVIVVIAIVAVSRKKRRSA